MARGATAKAAIAAKLKEVFGADYAGESAGKHYVWAQDDGERLQIAISLTCPKNPIGETPAATGLQFGDGIDFSAPAAPPAPPAPAEISEKEQENIAALMARLGL